MSKKIIAISLLSLLMINNASSFSAMRMFMKAFEWVGVKQIMEPITTTGGKIAADSSGNIFLVGETHGNPDGSSVGTFLTKYNRAGSKLWTKTISHYYLNSYGYACYNEYEDEGCVTRVGGVAIDASGNVFVTGHTNGGLDGNTTIGNIELYLIKYNKDGIKQWTKQYVFTGQNNIATAMTIDGSGNLFIGGYTTGAIFFQGFITKYNNNGDQIWVKKITSTGHSYVMGVATDNSGNVFATGGVTGLVGGSQVGATDAFVIKYNNAGDKQWTQQLGVVAKNTRANGVATDGSGNVFIGGYTNGGIDGNTLQGNNDAFIAKYDNAGYKQWTRQLGGVTKNTSATGITTDGSGNVFIGGTESFASVAHAFIAKYNDNGILK